MLPFTHTWLPFIYLYGMGGILFTIGVVLTYKIGSMNLKRKHHQRWFALLFFGFFWYMVLHAFLNLAALGHVTAAVWLLGGFIVLSIVGYVVITSRINSES